MWFFRRNGFWQCDSFDEMALDDVVLDKVSRIRHDSRSSRQFKLFCGDYHKIVCHTESGLYKNDNYETKLIQLLKRFLLSTATDLKYVFKCLNFNNLFICRSTSLCQTCLYRIKGICQSDHPFPSIFPILLCISNLFMSNSVFTKSQLYRSDFSFPKNSFPLLYHYLCEVKLELVKKIKQYECQTKYLTFRHRTIAFN